MGSKICAVSFDLFRFLPFPDRLLIFLFLLFLVFVFLFIGPLTFLLVFLLCVLPLSFRLFALESGTSDGFRFLILSLSLLDPSSWFFFSALFLVLRFSLRTRPNLNPGLAPSCRLNGMEIL